MNENKKRIYITVPISFEQKLKKLAEEDKRTTSNYIINLVEQVEKNKISDRV